jgi:hypothetical protein
MPGGRTPGSVEGKAGARLRGRDACGNPLTSSLAVVRHWPGRRAEPDPHRP